MVRRPPVAAPAQRNVNITANQPGVLAVGKTQFYHKGAQKVNDGSVRWSLDTLEALLLVQAHTPDLVNDEFVQDVVADEHAASGNYARVTPLTSVTVDLVAGVLQFQTDAVNFGASTTITAAYLCLYEKGTTDADSPLLLLCELEEGGEVSSSDGLFRITPAANGWHTIQLNQ